jgi:hypothetical protein
MRAFSRQPSAISHLLAPLRLCAVAPLLASLPLCLLASPASAQQVDLQIREEGSRAPVGGAIVRLLGDRGVAAQGLTNEQGRIVLRAAAPGSYRIKVDRIGWSGFTTPPVALAAGAVYQRELLMEARRVELPALEVRGRSRCDREGQGGPLAAALWDEIGKALTANVVTQRQGTVRLHVRGFVRELDQRSRPLREWVAASTLMRGQPFASLPPGALAEIGFVQQESHDSVTYAAPDAALLLSDEFVGTHCFRAVQGKDGLLGLAFEPTAGRKVADVKGTLWVDRATSELRFLEYLYTGLPGILARAGLGGRVEFRRLPAGTWIVSYWHVRTPTLTESETAQRRNVGRTFARLIGYTDLGGRAEIASDALGQVDRALLVGVVFDSVNARGLADAVVRVQGYQDSVLTDAEGRFRLAVPASGDQVVTVAHPRSRLLQQGTTRPALLSLGDTTRVEFTVSSLDSFVRALCGTPARGRSGVVGIAWGSDGKPAAGHEIRVRWNTSGGGVKEERRDVRADGLYALCELPPDQSLPVRLFDRIRPVDEQVLQLEWGAFRWVELRAGGTPAATPPGAVVSEKPR